MAFFAHLLVLISIFLLASYAHAFLNLNQVAGNQIRLNHLIRFKETNKQNSKAKYKFSNGSNQPSANNSRQCRLFITNLNKCQMEINKTQTNNSWQCQSFVNVLIDSWQQKCQMEIDKTETNNFRQCRSFVNVLIDSWQQKCRM